MYLWQQIAFLRELGLPHCQEFPNVLLSTSYIQDPLFDPKNK